MRDRDVRRGAVALLGTTAALAVVVVGWNRLRGAHLEPRVGHFANEVEYASWGDGPKTMLWLQGGPGSDIPRGAFGWLAASQFRPFLDQGYTVWSLTRRRNMPLGHTIADMADDVADVIVEKFGRVDLVVGISYGSLIAQYLAARHEDRVAQVVLALSGVRVSVWGGDVDRRWAEARAAGQLGEAGAVFLEYLLAGERWRSLRERLGPFVGRMFSSEETPAEDLRVEADAEVAFDSHDVLPHIHVPVLLLVAEHDRFFPTWIAAETQALIPDCTVVRYPGKGHVGAAMSGRIPRDVLAWLERRGPGRTASGPPCAG